MREYLDRLTLGLFLRHSSAFAPMSNVVEALLIKHQVLIAAKNASKLLDTSQAGRESFGSALFGFFALRHF